MTCRMFSPICVEFYQIYRYLQINCVMSFRFEYLRAEARVELSGNDNKERWRTDTNERIQRLTNKVTCMI